MLSLGQKLIAFLGYSIDFFPVLLQDVGIAGFFKHLEGRVDSAGTRCVETMGALFKGTDNLITMTRFILYQVQDNVFEVPSVKGTRSPRALKRPVFVKHSSSSPRANLDISCHISIYLILIPSVTLVKRFCL